MSQHDQDQGQAMRRQVMGDAFVDRALSSADAFSQPLPNAREASGFSPRSSARTLKAA